MVMFGVDVSSWQGAPDWGAVKASGASFAIIKCNEGSNQWYPSFGTQIEGAQAAGLLLGSYTFMRAGSGAAQADASIAAQDKWTNRSRHFVDFEYFMAGGTDPRPGGVPTDQDVQELAAYLDRFTQRTGQVPGVYTSGSIQPYIQGICDARGAATWLAAYPDGDTGWIDRGQYATSIIRQYSSSGIVSGINGRVDLNVTVLTPENWYASVGGGVPAPAPATKPVDGAIVDAVLRGNYGNGTDRENRLRAAGYDPSAVQAAVNARLGGGSGAQSIDDVARAVIRGDYGNEPTRSQRLRAAGYDPSTVQSKVNALLGAGGSPAPARSVDDVVAAVIRGDYGNEPQRSANLRAAGYDPADIQRRVNARLGGGSSGPKAVTQDVINAVIRGDYGNEPQRSANLRAAGYDPAAVQAAVNAQWG